MNIVLIGFMGSGKSTIGRVLAEIAGKPLLETDQIVEDREGASIAEIMASRGEGYFRDAECEVVAEAAASDGTVIAAGGGAVLDDTNVSRLRENGVLYFLEIDATDVMSRVDGGSDRPLLPEDAEGIRNLMSERASRYLEASDAVIPASGRAPREIAEEVLADFHGRTGEGA